MLWHVRNHLSVNIFYLLYPWYCAI